MKFKTLCNVSIHLPSVIHKTPTCLYNYFLNKYVLVHEQQRRSSAVKAGQAARKSIKDSSEIEMMFEASTMKMKKIMRCLAPSYY